MRLSITQNISAWQSLNSSLLLCCFVFISLSTSSLAAERTLKFPIGWEHANVSIYDMPEPSDYFSNCVDFDSYGKTKGMASGEVRVPDDAFIGIEIQAAEGYENFLAELPMSGIHRIELTGATLSESIMKSLERVESLRQLHLSDCTAGAINVDILNGATNLQYLLTMQDPNPDLHKFIAAWAAKCKQLQFYYDGHNLAADEIRVFEHHQAPIFLEVEFGKDAVEVIQALSVVPKLVALNVTVTPDVPENFHDGLAQLQTVEFFNWGGGQLDGNFLNSLAKMKRLKAIRVQGNAKVADDFVERLPELTDLEIVTFNFQLSDYQKMILPDLLMSMEKLREMPRMTNASTEQLQALSGRTEIRSLEIIGLDKSVSADQLAKIISANPRLRTLQLSGVPWTPEIATAIGQCEKLQYLSLVVDEFDGSLLTTPKSLRGLEAFRLEIENDPRNLNVLEQLPNLERVEISVGTYDKANWSFIAGAQSLRSVSIQNGFCDDSVVDYLERNRSIRRFSTSATSVLTDAGVARLRGCTQLESLDVNGIISEASIEWLGQMPKLQYLKVGTNLLDDSAKERLKKKLSGLKSFYLRDVPKSFIGADGFHRMVPDEGREKFDVIEGSTLETMLGTALTPELKDQLDGKVVLIEFWGTWCGPCLNFVPELERLQSLYKDNGLQVLTIHSQNKSETATKFVLKHPKPWPNLIDYDGELEKRFSVPIWPSIYCFGRDGKLKIALPHRWSLQTQIEKLVDK